MVTPKLKVAREAFTLVEILIVVVILGILASIVVPQFAKAGEDAWAGNLAAQLRTLQGQTELYFAQHSNTYPDFAGQGWNELILGGYIKEVPKNPAYTGTNGESSIRVSANPAARGAGNAAWVWNSARSTFYASNFNETTGKVSTTPGQ